MIRTQISLQPEQMEQARREACRRGITLAALVRQALEEYLDEDGRRRWQQQALAAVSGFRSGYADTSSRHDESLAEGGRW